MEKMVKLLALIGVPCLLLASNVSATLTATVDLSPTGYRDPNSYGGEFTAYISGNSALSSYILDNYSSKAKATINNQTGFETFCVEMTQTIVPGDSYNASIGPEIVNGSGSTPLTVGVAWLYMEFATGGLANFGIDSYTYSTSGTGRELAADELQDAIWYLQGELGSSGDSYTDDKLYDFNCKTDPFVTLVENMFGKDATESDITYGNNFGVQPLNLSTTEGCPPGETVYAQDQLVYCPVPEPATFAAGAALLLPLGVGIIRNFRKARQS